MPLHDGQLVRRLYQLEVDQVVEDDGRFGSGQPAKEIDALLMIRHKRMENSHDEGGVRRVEGTLIDSETGEAVDSPILGRTSEGRHQRA